MRKDDDLNKNILRPFPWFNSAFTKSGGFENQDLLKRTPFPGQTVRQLKHPTHREKSTVLSSVFMHSALHCEPQIPQLVQVVSSSTILKTEIREINPKKVPTGQTVLQYSLPFLSDSRITRKSIKIENPKEIQL